MDARGLALHLAQALDSNRPDDEAADCWTELGIGSCARASSPLENVAPGKFLLRHSSVRYGQTLVAVDHLRRTKPQLNARYACPSRDIHQAEEDLHHLRALG